MEPNSVAATPVRPVTYPPRPANNPAGAPEEGNYTGIQLTSQVKINVNPCYTPRTMEVFQWVNDQLLPAVSRSRITDDQKANIAPMLLSYFCGEAKDRLDYAIAKGKIDPNGTHKDLDSFCEALMISDCFGFPNAELAQEALTTLEANVCFSDMNNSLWVQKFIKYFPLFNVLLQEDSYKSYFDRMAKCLVVGLRERVLKQSAWQRWQQLATAAAAEVAANQNTPPRAWAAAMSALSDYVFEELDTYKDINMNSQAERDAVRKSVQDVMFNSPQHIPARQTPQAPVHHVQAPDSYQVPANVTQPSQPQPSTVNQVQSYPQPPTVQPVNTDCHSLVPYHQKPADPMQAMMEMMASINNTNMQMFKEIQESNVRMHKEVLDAINSNKSDRSNRNNSGNDGDSKSGKKCFLCKEKHSHIRECRDPRSYAMQLAHTRPAKLKNMSDKPVMSNQIKKWMIEQYNAMHPNDQTTLEQEVNASLGALSASVSAISNTVAVQPQTSVEQARAVLEAAGLQVVTAQPVSHAPAPQAAPLPPSSQPPPGHSHPPPDPQSGHGHPNYMFQ